MLLLLAAEIRKKRLLNKYEELKVSDSQFTFCRHELSIMYCYLLVNLMTLFSPPLIIRHLANLKLTLKRGGGRMLLRTADTCHIVGLTTMNRSLHLHNVSLKQWIDPCVNTMYFKLRFLCYCLWNTGNQIQFIWTWLLGVRLLLKGFNLSRIDFKFLCTKTGSSFLFFGNNFLHLTFSCKVDGQ